MDIIGKFERYDGPEEKIPGLQILWLYDVETGQDWYEVQKVWLDAPGWYLGVEPDGRVRIVETDITRLVPLGVTAVRYDSDETADQIRNRILDLDTGELGEVAPNYEVPTHG